MINHKFVENPHVSLLFLNSSQIEGPKANKFHFLPFFANLQPLPNDVPGNDPYDSFLKECQAPCACIIISSPNYVSIYKLYIIRMNSITQII